MLAKNRLGSTDLMVSSLGLGTVKFGRNQQVKYPKAFSLPSVSDMANLLALANDFGINLLDTAPAYGESELHLGKLLKGQRDRWVVSTKVGEAFENRESSYDYSSVSIQKSIDRSLARLNTDYLDLVLVHSNGNDIQIIEEDEIFATLSALKQAGKIRGYGMSTKTVEGGLCAVAHSDVVMVTYNPVSVEEKSVIEKAATLKKGVFIKKAFASGHLDKLGSDNPVYDALRFIFSEKGVSSVILGTINPDHLRENVEAAVQVLI